MGADALDAVFAALQQVPGLANPLRAHLLGSHTTIEQVGAEVAEQARARNLVLTHLVPANNPVARWRQAQRGYSGRLIVAADLRPITVGARGTDSG